MDLTHLIIAGLTAALNVVAWVLPSSSPWHAIAAGAVAALGGLSALIAGQQSVSAPGVATSSSALHSGSAPAPEPEAPQVVQGPPEQDQQGLP